MAGHRKRAFDAKQNRPSKKQKRQQYHSDSSSDDDQQESFNSVNLFDSDDDVHNATAQDASEIGNSSNDSLSSEDDRPTTKKTKKHRSNPAKAVSQPAAAVLDDDEEQDNVDDDDDDDGNENDDDDMESNIDEYNIDSDNGSRKTKSKRNDPTAFATSMSKILSTKLSTSKRSDPVLSRSAAAHEASKAAVDSALEAKARKHLKDEKKKTLEKGRIRDVLVATRDDTTGEPQESTTQVLEAERKLRKVAQRGVVKLFNAVRAAQVKALEADREARRDGTIGMNNREAKVNELSKKGFLDLIASGGGGLKRGGLEEA